MRAMGRASSSPNGLHIIVLGYVVRGPLAGLTWHHLQYVVGLAHLGQEVYFLEGSDGYPSCYTRLNLPERAGSIFELALCRSTAPRAQEGKV